MDRYFGKKGMWIALGLVAVLFLCIMVSCLGAAVTFAPRPAGTWMQAPAGENGAAPPAVVYHGHGGWGPLGIIGAGLGLLFKLAFFGLLLVLLLRLVRRLLWGGGHACLPRWHACPPPWYGPWQGAPQGAPGSEGQEPEAGAGWGPSTWRRHAWHHHRHHHPWGPPPWWDKSQPGPAPGGPAGEEGPDAPEGEYTGPME